MTFVILIHDRGYVQPGRKPKLGPIDTAIKFATQEAAMKSTLSYLKQRGKEYTAEVVPSGAAQERTR